MSLLGLGLSMVAPRVAAEAASSGAARFASKRIANRLVQGAVSETGQRVIAKAGGQRLAAAVASPRGQMVANYMLKKDISQRIQGEGRYAPAKGPKYVAAPAPVTADPYGNTVGQTGAASGMLTSGSGNANLWANRQQGPRQQSSGFGGTGKGWWALNDQISGAQANIDPAQMSDFSVGRGPSRYSMIGAGAGANMRARIGAGAREGVGDAMREFDNPDKQVTIRERRPGVTGPPADTTRAGHSRAERQPEVKSPLGDHIGTNPGDTQVRRARLVPRSSNSTGSGPETQHNARVTTPGAVENVPFGGVYNRTSTQVGSSTTPGFPRLEAFGTGAGEVPSGPTPLALGPGPQRKTKRPPISPAAMSRIRGDLSEFA